MNKTVVLCVGLSLSGPAIAASSPGAAIDAYTNCIKEQSTEEVRKLGASAQQYVPVIVFSVVQACSRQEIALAYSSIVGLGHADGGDKSMREAMRKDIRDVGWFLAERWVFELTAPPAK